MNFSILGDMEITFNPDNSTSPLYLKLGKWLTGYLSPYQGSFNVYLIIWDSDFIQDYYFNYGSDVDTFVVYDNEDNLQVVLGDMRVPFVRNAVLISYPEIPWDPSSCSPESTNKFTPS
jgi:hypothetical protein